MTCLDGQQIRTENAFRVTGYLQQLVSDLQLREGWKLLPNTRWILHAKINGMCARAYSPHFVWDTQGEHKERTGVFCTKPSIFIFIFFVQGFRLQLLHRTLTSFPTFPSQVSCSQNREIKLSERTHTSISLQNAISSIPVTPSHSHWNTVMTESGWSTCVD